MRTYVAVRKWMAVLSVLAGAGEAWAAQHQVVAGDTLWTLAEKNYQNPHHWRRIAEANAQIVKDPHWIYPGQSLMIPDLAQEASLSMTVPGPTEASAAIAVEVPQPSAPEVVEEAPAASIVRADDGPAPREIGENMSDPADKDGLVEDIPPAMSTYNIGRPRLKMDKGFRPDGAIVESVEDEGMEKAAGAGQMITVRLEDGVSAALGERFTVYRQVGVLDSDVDKKAIYMSAIAQIEALAEARGRKRRFVILSAEDMVHERDWVKRGGEIK